ncbi:MAG: thiamine diphosphokinase [Aestuariivirgaceae bacterium]|nr:thiamine diphosphokinase [Aestuariivirgaceae bacterium]
MNTRFSILLGGGLLPTQRLAAQTRGTRAIAADSGILHAETLNLPVELWVGDFDSTPPDAMPRFARVPREAWPADKDRTDGEIAADAAITRGASSLVFVGGLGGQTDHALGHFTLALRVARQGVKVLITSGDEEAYPILAGTHEFDLPPGSRISLIAFTDLTGLTLEGVRWPLQAADIPLGSTWTLSNIAEGPVRIQLQSGYGIAVAYPAD